MIFSSEKEYLHLQKILSESPVQDVDVNSSYSVVCAMYFMLNGINKSLSAISSKHKSKKEKKKKEKKFKKRKTKI